MSAHPIPHLIRFTPGYMERIWGGDTLARRYGHPLPGGVPIGEAWLVSDHPVHTSLIAEGPLQGVSLHALVCEHPRAVLGHNASLTPNGRFPLLLKLLDARDILSLQVHPDDATAARLGEVDGGKTEAWYILQAEPGCTLITGLEPSCSRAQFEEACRAGALRDCWVEQQVQAGDAVFVPSGTVHAIGAGILLAEIQQNSDVTYRIFDFNRGEGAGKPRPLHLEQAVEAIHFGAPPAAVEATAPLPGSHAVHECLACCPYFTVERVVTRGAYSCDTGGQSFHLLLAIHGPLDILAHGETLCLRDGEAVLLTGQSDGYEVTGDGAFLDYWVPATVARPPVTD